MNGDGNRGGLSKLGAAITIVVVISLVALLLQLLYILYRRRLFRHQINSTDQFSIYDFYFFCIRLHHSHRVESNSVTAATGTNGVRNSSRRSDLEVVDVDLLKLQGIFAPPRFLFTIKEEDREDLESIADKSVLTSDKEVNKSKDGRVNREMRLEESFTASGESMVAVEIVVDGGREATPFSTPCASPIYFTPSASPVHQE